MQSNVTHQTNLYKVWQVPYYNGRLMANLRTKEVVIIPQDDWEREYEKALHSFNNCINMMWNECLGRIHWKFIKR